MEPKKIEWNKVTWYSKLASIVVFLLLLPILTFYLGVRYQQAQESAQPQAATGAQF